MAATSKAARDRARRKREAARKAREAKTTAIAVRESPSAPGMALARRQPPRNARKLWDAAVNELTPNTRSAYKGEWKRFGQWWDDLDLDDKDPEIAQKALMLLSSFPEPFEPREIVLRYRSYLDHEKEKRGFDASKGDKPGVSPATRARAIRALNSMIDKLNFVGFVAWKLDVPSGKSSPVKNVKGPDQRTFRRLLQHIEDKYGLEELCLLHALRTLALRAHEVCKIRVVDLNAADQTLTVLGKGNKTAHVAVSDTVWEIFQRQVRAQGRLAENPVFVFGDPNKGLPYHQLYLRVKEWGKGIGISLWPHALRHSGITRAAEVTRQGDMSVKELQKFSRHAKAETALGYIDALDDGAKKIADKMLDD